ncbi:hypothetical protein HYH03_007057 [Edaphochlamys debaryana]|uniref:Uncharacterized protein n=1 Tax=Edaphochlamys debaryana TaxID=47281 RepID=A0A836BZM4_9CHLO|nr:hypothetical protein HYH03_007057 [Edaphochlamys debaryana]|eukprot:KAG2494815.1 hypothetical protein HYH03_007057 [Edaphochlamys debaryana]
MIRKLDSGQPINVVAWGSSVTSEYGGCGTESSRNFLLTPGIPRRCDPWLNTDTATDERDGFATGWGTLFMRLLNDTWPHQDHKFANNGVAGCMLFCDLDSTCEQSVLPNPLDLIIMENMHTWTMPEHIEAAIRNVIHDASIMSPDASRPAVILYNSYAVVETVETVEWTECIAHQRCNTSCIPEANGFKHSVGKALPQTHEPQTLELGALYGIDVLSSNTFLHMLMRDGLMPREGVAACEALSKLFMDTIHPRMLGRYMMGELLFASLQRARDWLQAHPDAVAPGLPMRPYANGSLLLEQKRCYMSTVHGPEFQHHMHAHNVPKSYLDVVSSHGWQLVFYDNNQTHRHKPGLVAWHPDSVLQFRINTDMRQPGFDPGGVAGKCQPDVLVACKRIVCKREKR